MSEVRDAQTNIGRKWKCRQTGTRNSSIKDEYLVRLVFLITMHTNGAIKFLQEMYKNIICAVYE